jgi:hypothetical protein
VSIESRLLRLEAHEEIRQLAARYAADVLQHPLSVEGRFHFPGNPMIRSAELPGKWATWRQFWGE